jgi:ABC-2 type transport system permease protein
MAPPATAVLVLVALARGTAVFALLAALAAAVTRTMEIAQVTTLPVLLINRLHIGMRGPFRAH